MTYISGFVPPSIEEFQIKSVRDTILDRDHLQQNEIDDLFDEFEDEIDDGADAEEALLEVFGLEPDYLFDSEIQSILQGYDIE